jgi:hypothetical protein
VPADKPIANYADISGTLFWDDGLLIFWGNVKQKLA